VCKLSTPNLHLHTARSPKKRKKEEKRADMATKHEQMRNAHGIPFGDALLVLDHPTFGALVYEPLYTTPATVGMRTRSAQTITDVSRGSWKGDTNNIRSRWTPALGMFGYTESKFAGGGAATAAQPFASSAGSPLPRDTLHTKNSARLLISKERAAKIAEGRLLLYPSKGKTLAFGGHLKQAGYMKLELTKFRMRPLSAAQAALVRFRLVKIYAVEQNLSKINDDIIGEGLGTHMKWSRTVLQASTLTGTRTELETQAWQHVIAWCWEGRGRHNNHRLKGTDNEREAAAAAYFATYQQDMLKQIELLSVVEQICDGRDTMYGTLVLVVVVAWYSTQVV
jgi:hypothetical protein